MTIVHISCSTAHAHCVSVSGSITRDVQRDQFMASAGSTAAADGQDVHEESDLLTIRPL